MELSLASAVAVAVAVAAIEELWRRSLGGWYLRAVRGGVVLVLC